MRLASLVGVSTPNYVPAPILVLVFSVGLGLLPVSGRDAPGALVLPAVTMGLALAALLVQRGQGHHRLRLGLLGLLLRLGGRNGCRRGLSLRLLALVAYRHERLPDLDRVALLVVQLQNRTRRG